MDSEKEVVTVKNPIDALYTLRIKGGAFDLVVTDVHMPDMNGFELQQVITEEFKLPVVLMSADNEEGVMLKGLETGAAFFITKPVSPEDVRDLWQYTALKKKTVEIIDETETNQDKNPEAKNPEEIIDSGSSINEDMLTKRDSKRRSLIEDVGDYKEEENFESITSKKPKIVWTNALHNRFLEAIRSIGLDRAVPKKILELMKVPGLTRENVASHLQKYRIFLRRVADSSYTLQSANPRSLTSSVFQSNYASGNSTLTLNKFSLLSQQQPDHERLTSAFQRKIGENVTVLNNYEPDAASFLNPEATSSNCTLQSGSRQSLLLSNRANIWRPALSTTVPPYRPTQIGIRMESNNLQGGLLLNGQTLSGLINSRSLLGQYLPVTQVASEGVSNTIAINSGSTLGTETSSGTTRIDNPNLNTSYVGYRLANIEQLAHEEYQVGDASTSLEGINCLVDEIQNGSNNIDQLAQFVSPDDFGGGNQYSATIAGGIPGAGVQLLPPTPSLHNSFGNGQESDPTFSPAFDLSAIHDFSTPLSPGLGDLSSSLLNQFEIPSPVQGTGREGEINSDFYSVEGQMDNAFPWFDENFNQQGQAYLTDADNYEGVASESQQLNDTLQSAAERAEDEFLESLLAYGPYEGDETLEGI